MILFPLLRTVRLFSFCRLLFSFPSLSSIMKNSYKRKISELIKSIFSGSFGKKRNFWPFYFTV
ncbi:hypothetical protein CHCC14688_2812 [Bacillus licheniformis]|nr:hypothetical protein CHCC14688_2812 [Bacillus licheniformis]